MAIDFIDIQGVRARANSDWFIVLVPSRPERLIEVLRGC